MTVQHQPADTLLVAALAAAAELTRNSPDHRIVVGWLSRHAAALEHAVFPTARRQLAGPDVPAQVELTRQLERVLLQLHQALNGDGHGSGAEPDVVARWLSEVLTTHISGVSALLVQLAGVLSDDEWSVLLTQHGDALRNAPSRPHPNTPHGRVGERFAFTVTGAVDHVLDTLDSRVRCRCPLSARP